MASVTAKTGLSTQTRIASIGKLNYLDFFGFSAPPFSNSSDVSKPYLSASLDHALTQVEAALAGSRGGLLVVSGAPGSGKTTLVNHALALHAESFRVAKLNRTMLAETELLQVLLHGFGLDPEGLDRALMIDNFLEMVDEETTHGRRVVVVIDEAQNLKPAILKLLQRLIERDGPERGRLFIILIAQDGFQQTLARPELAELTRLVLYQTYLDTLTESEVSAYIRFQLAEVAEAEQNPFTDRAMTRIQMLTGGSLRLINTLCDFVLFNSSLGQIRRITPELVQTTFNALQWDPARRPSPSPPGSESPAESEPPIRRLVLEYDRNLEFPIDKDVITIGRSADNDISIRNLRVSRLHAQIRVSDEGLIIEDLGSTNGVFVNEERVESRVLKDGDIIAIDENRMRLILSGGSKR